MRRALRSPRPQARATRLACPVVQVQARGRGPHRFRVPRCSGSSRSEATTQGVLPVVCVENAPELQNSTTARVACSTSCNADRHTIHSQTRSSHASWGLSTPLALRVHHATVRACLRVSSPVSSPAMPVPLALHWHALHARCAAPTPPSCSGRVHMPAESVGSLRRSAATWHWLRHSASRSTRSRRWHPTCSDRHGAACRPCTWASTAAVHASWHVAQTI